MNADDSFQPKINPWLIAIAVILPTFIEVLDTTVVSVAQETIAGNLASTVSQATWIQTGYLISNAIVLPATAWFSAVFGRKRFLLTCIGIFTLASFACGAAPTLTLLIIASVVQGMGGGALQPISQAILMESFPPAKRGSAMAAYVLGVVLAPVLGPVLGGWLTENYSWRWIFYINIPCGLIAMWLVQLFVFDPEYLRNIKPGRLDAPGFLFLGIWLATMQTVLNKGQDEDWFNSNFICWFSVISAIAFVAFLIREFSAREPLADLRVFGDLNFLFSTILISIVFLLLYGIMNLQPLLAQSLLGYTAFASGVAQAPRGLGMMILTPLVGVLTGKVDNRLLIGLGMILTAAASFLMGDFNLDISSHQFFWPNFIQGMGMALTTVPLMTVALATISNEQMGNATGLFALARNLAGSIGIAVAIAMQARGALKHQAYLVAHLTPYDQPFQNAVRMGEALLAPSLGPAQAHAGALETIYQSLILQSNMLSFADEFRWLALICAISTPLVFLFRKGQGHREVMMH
ncbi:MAG TPA: DHA2 family efflux MFS transporter permease subunit [Candidatus Methylacidiphilales bacterium]|nr:DHA2 family efflux MFS transporter permease subunit [Candidatus Methylacidiphilales bacterium]